MREPTVEVREPQGLAVRASRMARAWMAESWKGLLVAGAAGVFMAFVAAFDMGEVPFLRRLAYWVPVMMAGSLLGHGAARLVARQPRIGESRIAMWAAITTLMAFPATLVVWAITEVVFHDQRLDVATLPYFAGAVLPVSAAMTAIMILVNMPGPATHAPGPGAPAAAVKFAQRLTPKIKGGAIWAVEADDHYLRVHTSKGSDLVLMRLADALGELEGLEGAQVHRSWWVAKEGVAEVKRDGQRVTLVLRNGASAPVSRPNVKALREAGWF
jgi:hypothetical protein